MMNKIEKWFCQPYLKTIKFGHLMLITLFGIWPCYYDYEAESYKTTWYLRFYSVTILASIVALLINTAVTLYNDISEAHPSETGTAFAVVLTSASIFAIVIIYLVQIKKVEQINAVVEEAKTLFQQICSSVDFDVSSIDWNGFLLKFTIYIVFNGSLMCRMTISRMYYLSPKAHADFSIIFFYSIPNMLLCVMVSIFFCGLSILDKYFCILNRQLKTIADDKTFDAFSSEITPSYRRMKQCCALSDKIDTISSLHFKLCRLTHDFCEVFAMQLLVCHSFTVFLWIFKLFLDFLIIRRAIIKKLYDMLPMLLWIAFVNTVSSVIDLASIAGVCSKIKLKIEMFSIQLTQSKVKLSPYGLYDIDYSLVFSTVSRLAQLSARQFTSSAANNSKMEVHPGYKKLKELQKKYQANDGKPVHLKRPGDKALMYLTFFGCGVGLVGVGQLFYELS
ncbi:hypothetical protein HA402_006324 [Bradysia odoriphaga]|nr:hypothetical protein HA402_006324 [Bradysia odoriphaga]